MRSRCLFAALAALAVSPLVVAQMPVAPTAPAQPSPYPAQATVLLAQAEVYSGPSTSYYPTSRLRYGDRVVALGESKKQPGWLEIVPPAGSFSWVDARYVKQVPGVDKIGIIDSGDPKGTVPVLPGSSVVNKEPNVEIARIPTGTQVLLLDRATSSAGGSWYPIAPVATEVRFLSMDAVRPGQSVAASNPWNNTLPVSGTTPIQPNTAHTLQQLVQSAQQAVAAGSIDRARLLYIEALGQASDPAWRNYIQNELARLSNTTWVPTPTYPAGSPPPVQPTSQPARPTVDPSLASQPAAVGQKQWSQWGTLRTASFQSREGQPMYVLENRQTGQPLMYITTQAGTSLREYVNQTIALYGTLAYRNDDYIRMQYLIAEQVATPPTGQK